MARASKYGSLGTSGLTEYATYNNAASYSTQDAFNALLIGSGDTNGSVRTALFNSANTVGSAFNGFGTSPAGYMIDF